MNHQLGWKVDVDGMCWKMDEMKEESLSNGSQIQSVISLDEFL